MFARYEIVYAWMNLLVGGGGISVSSNCSDPLGMEDGRISDDQLTASSSYEPNLVGPGNGRLNSERGGGAWCPKSLIDNSQDTEEYMEIDLLKDHVISGVLVQGRFANGLGKEFAEYVALEFKQQSQQRFSKYTDEAGGSVIKANVNTFQVVKYNLTKVVVASKVRIVPLSVYPRTVCLRVELEGCEYPGNFFSVLAEEARLDTLENLVMKASSDQEEWNQNIYMAIAIGILVTVLCASGAAVALVLYRSKIQAEKRSISRYNFMSTESDCSVQDPASRGTNYTSRSSRSCRLPGGQLHPSNHNRSRRQLGQPGRLTSSSTRNSVSPDHPTQDSLDSWGYPSNGNSLANPSANGSFGYPSNSNSLVNTTANHSWGRRTKEEIFVMPHSSTRNPLYTGDIIRHPQQIYRTSESISSLSARERDV